MAIFKRAKLSSTAQFSILIPSTHPLSTPPLVALRALVSSVFISILRGGTSGIYPQIPQHLLSPTNPIYYFSKSLRSRGIRSHNTSCICNIGSNDCFSFCVFFYPWDRAATRRRCKSPISFHFLSFHFHCSVYYRTFGMSWKQIFICARFGPRSSFFKGKVEAGGL